MLGDSGNQGSGQQAQRVALSLTPLLLGTWQDRDTQMGSLHRKALVCKTVSKGRKSIKDQAHPRTWIFPQGAGVAPDAQQDRAAEAHSQGPGI